MRTYEQFLFETSCLVLNTTSVAFRTISGIQTDILDDLGIRISNDTLCKNYEEVKGFLDRLPEKAIQEKDDVGKYNGDYFDRENIGLVTARLAYDKLGPDGFCEYLKENKPVLVCLFKARAGFNILKNLLPSQVLDLMKCLLEIRENDYKACSYKLSYHFLDYLRFGTMLLGIHDFDNPTRDELETILRLKPTDGKVLAYFAILYPDNEDILDIIWHLFAEDKACNIHGISNEYRLKLIKKGRLDDFPNMLKMLNLDDIDRIKLLINNCPEILYREPRLFQRLCGTSGIKGKINEMKQENPTMAMLLLASVMCQEKTDNAPSYLAALGKRVAPMLKLYDYNFDSVMNALCDHVLEHGNLDGLLTMKQQKAKSESFVRIMYDGKYEDFDTKIEANRKIQELESQGIEVMSMTIKRKDD